MLKNCITKNIKFLFKEDFNEEVLWLHDKINDHFEMNHLPLMHRMRKAEKSLKEGIK